MASAVVERNVSSTNQPSCGSRHPLVVRHEEWMRRHSGVKARASGDVGSHVDVNITVAMAGVFFHVSVMQATGDVNVKVLVKVVVLVVLLMTLVEGIH